MELIEAILSHFDNTEDRGVACEFCWLIRDRAEEAWSDGTITRLVHYATNHSDPVNRLPNTEPPKEGRDIASRTPHDLENDSLNCIRGAGAHAIGVLLWRHPEWLERLTPCIDRLVSDPHPAVRIAAINACLPVMNLNRDQAVSWFCIASTGDLRVATSQAGRHYFNHGIPSHIDTLAPIIRKMMSSTFDEVAKEGAMQVTARWLFNGLFEEELTACRSGTVPQRKGVAQIASWYILNPEYSGRCEDLLLPLCNDENADVRHKAKRVFFNNEVFTLPNAPRVVAKYVKSKAFADDSFSLMLSLREFAESLTPFTELILMICDEFTGPLREASKNTNTGAAGSVREIPPILLRLYEQAQDQNDAQVLSRCLDAWDLLFEKRVGSTRELTNEIEK